MSASTIFTLFTLFALWASFAFYLHAALKMRRAARTLKAMAEQGTMELLRVQQLQDDLAQRIMAHDAEHQPTASRHMLH